MPRNRCSEAALLSLSRVLRLETTQSTNADALRLAREGEIGPLWVVAREQMGGRGRHGRVWHSPPGNLYASLLLVDPCTPEVAPQLGFVAGVALADAANELVGRDTVRLKWPNDLLHDGAKLSGILLEATRRTDGAFVCVIGIGVNCASHPDDLPYAATHLSTIAGRAISPDDLHPLLDRAVTRWLARWDQGRNFLAVREAWLGHAANRHRPVTVAIAGKTVEGRFETIDETGRLVIETGTGLVTVDAGDVTFAPAAREPDPVS